MQSLREPPAPMTVRERRLVLGTSLAVVLTRLWAIAATPWDWDEIQFSAGVREFQCGYPFHHPHPPGFPLYIFLAKGVKALIGSDFRALQVVVVLAACTLFPLAFFLARELHFRFSTSYLAALLLVFLPNVWYFGATAFSDVPALALTLASCVLLLRGCRDARAFVWGCVLLGAAGGIRIQAAFIGYAPFLAAAWSQRRRWRLVLAGTLSGLAVVAVCYAGAALATDPPAAWVAALEGEERWVHDIDSFHSPLRPPLTALFDDFFVYAFAHAARLGRFIAGLAALGLVAGAVRRDRAVGMAMAMFFPSLVFGWLMLSYNLGVQRYSMAWALLYTLLVAYAGALVAQWTRFRAAQAIVVVPLIAVSAWWTAPAIASVRHHRSPTFAAATWLRAHVPPRTPIWSDTSMTPVSEYFLADRVVRPADAAQLARSRVGRGEYYVIDGALDAPDAIVYTAPLGHVQKIHPPHFLEVTVLPAAEVWSFEKGWYGQEWSAQSSWRWSSGRAEALIPAMNGRARLGLTLASPSEISPRVSVWLNGRLVSEFVVTPTPSKHEWVVDSRADAPNDLVITTSATWNPAKAGASGDARDLGVVLFGYGWDPL